MLHQDKVANGCLDIQTKHMLQLAYELQLQDRILESVQVFKQIDISNIQADGNDLACQIPYDYMAAYYDFLIDETKEYKTARSIIKKYENSFVGVFKSKFKKIEDQLNEIDEFFSGKSPANKTPEEKDKATPSLKRSGTLKRKEDPKISSIEIDEDSGQLTIESENIDKFVVKYYLIDAEILFS